MKKVPGNPWFIATLWLARWRLRCAASPEELDKGLALITWAAEHALPSGTMAEQLHPYSGEPMSVSPLTWSHAAYVSAVREYISRTRHLNRCPTCDQPLPADPTAVEARGAARQRVDTAQPLKRQIR